MQIKNRGRLISRNIFFQDYNTSVSILLNKPSISCLLIVLRQKLISLFVVTILFFCAAFGTVQLLADLHHSIKAGTH